MNDTKKPNATQGSDEAVMPKNVAETGEDLNALSENTDGDGQHRIEEHAAEIEKAKEVPDRGIPPSTVRMPPD